MWKWIKSLFDFNKDNKITAEDLELARALAEQSTKVSNEKINKFKKEVDDVVVAAKTVKKEVGDVVDLVKKKPARKKKTSSE